MNYTYDFSNKKRNLTDLLCTVIKDEPRFISNFFKTADSAKRIHTWREDQIQRRGFYAARISNGTMDVYDTAGLRPGMSFIVRDNPALFRIIKIEGSKIQFKLLSSNGSSVLLNEKISVENAELVIVSIPEIVEDPESLNWNSTQLFMKMITISEDQIRVKSYDSTNHILNRQTALALGDLARDLNRVALFGCRDEGTSGDYGEAGGLYSFGCVNGLAIDAEKSILNSDLIFQAAQNIINAGGEPMQILCSPLQARLLSKEYRQNLQILRSDDLRGAYVAVIINEINGRGMTIMADPDVPLTDAWILDSSGLAISFLREHPIGDEDVTTGNYDGIRRLISGELTFEFRNASQRCCRISNLAYPLCRDAKQDGNND